MIRLAGLNGPCESICDDNAAAPCSAWAEAENLGGALLKFGGDLCDLAGRIYGDLFPISELSIDGAKGLWISLEEAAS